MTDTFDRAETIVQEFLNGPAPNVGNEAVTVNVSYPLLVHLVRKAYTAGIEDERSRRALVSPFGAPLAPTDRFSMIEFPDKALKG